jgi:hypothetical protein
MASKILKVIFLLLVAGVMLYVLRSGIVGTSFQSLKSLSFGSSTNNSAGGFFGYSIGGGTTNGNPSSGSGSAPTAASGATSSINPADVPTGFTMNQLSPFFHEVRIGGTSYGGFGFYGQITLNADLPAGANSTSSPPAVIDVTNWQIKTKTSGEYIPQAVNLYDPSGLAAASDIQMRNGDNVYLYSSQGPFNLRLNKCIGYIAADNKTIPAIPAYCPYVDNSIIQNFTGACQNYVRSLSGCTVPDLNNLQIPFTDYACRDYLANNFNYHSCFDAHVGDGDFLSNQIWVWTGKNVVDQYHDQVELLDRNGLLVDVYKY